VERRGQEKEGYRGLDCLVGVVSEAGLCGSGVFGGGAGEEKDRVDERGESAVCAAQSLGPRGHRRGREEAGQYGGSDASEAAGESV